MSQVSNYQQFYAISNVPVALFSCMSGTGHLDGRLRDASDQSCSIPSFGTGNTIAWQQACPWIDPLRNYFEFLGGCLYIVGCTAGMTLYPVDTHVVSAISAPRHWPLLCRALGLPMLSSATCRWIIGWPENGCSISIALGNTQLDWWFCFVFYIAIVAKGWTTHATVGPTFCCLV